MLARAEVRLEAATGKIAPNRVLNRPLEVDPRRAARRHWLSFDPDEDPAEIQQRIDTMSFKDGLRNDGGWTLRGEVPSRR